MSSTNFKHEESSFLELNAVYTDIAAYLNLEDLFQWCSTTNQSALHLKEKHVWLAAGNYEPTGFLFAGLDKSTLKELVQAVRGIEVLHEAIEINGIEQARAAVQASRQAKAKRAQHLRGHGVLASTFATSFEFDPEEVEKWVAQPSHPLASYESVVCAGDDVLALALHLHDGVLCLSVESMVADAPLSWPLLFHFRGLSPAVMLRKEFAVRSVGSLSRGTGLCSFPVSRKDGAGTLLQGLCCVVFVCDASDEAFWAYSRRVDSLNIDRRQ